MSGVTDTHGIVWRLCICQVLLKEVVFSDQSMNCQDVLRTSCQKGFTYTRHHCHIRMYIQVCIRMYIQVCIKICLWHMWMSDHSWSTHTCTHTYYIQTDCWILTLVFEWVYIHYYVYLTWICKLCKCLRNYIWSSEQYGYINWHNNIREGHMWKLWFMLNTFV